MHSLGVAAVGRGMQRVRSHLVSAQCLARIGQSPRPRTWPPPCPLPLCAHGLLHTDIPWPDLWLAPASSWRLEISTPPPSAALHVVSDRQGPRPAWLPHAPKLPSPPAAPGPPGPCPHPAPPWSVLPAGAGFLLPRGSSSASLIRQWLLGIGSHICSPVWPRYPARRLEHGAGSHSECGSRGFRRPWPGTHDSLARHCLLQTES